MWQPCELLYTCYTCYHVLLDLDALNSVLFTVTSAEVFHRCIGDEVINANKLFSIEACPSVRHIINITSAIVGFGQTVETNGSFTQCRSLGGATCTRKTNHSSILRCNGQRSCSFGQDVLRFASPDKLCDQRQHANFITITYHCISGKHNQ